MQQGWGGRDGKVEGGRGGEGQGREVGREEESGGEGQGKEKPRRAMLGVYVT